MTQFVINRQGGSGTGSAIASVVSGGALGATETLNCSGNAETWLVGTLDANCVVTISNLASGCAAKLLLTQDATGGRSLTVSDGTNSSLVTIPTTASSACEVDISSDGTNLYVDVAGGTNGADVRTDALSGARVQKLRTWSYDPSNGGSGSAPGAGVLQVVRVPWAINATVAEAFVNIAAIGTGATALANCYMGIYNSTGTLIAKTADQSTSWGTGGNTFRRPALVAEAGQSLTIAAAQDTIYIAFLVGTQSTTNVQMARSSNVGTVSNIGLSASDPFRFFTLSTGLTAMPSSITATSGAAGIGWVVGLY